MSPATSPAPKKEKTAEDLVEDWRSHLEAHGYRESTLRHYPALARGWLTWLRSEGVSYDKAQAEHADRHIEHLRTERNLSLWTIRCAVAPLRTWYKWLKRRGYVWENPFECLDRIRAKPKLVRPLTEAEVQALMRAATHPQNRAMWEVFYATGARVSSVLALKMADVDLEARRLYFRFVKGGGELMGILTRTAVDALSVYLEWRAAFLKEHGVDSPWLWVGAKGSNRIRVDTLRGRLKADAAQAGITTRIHPHRMRHSIATHLMEHGADLRVIQELLGHSSADTTAHYAKVALAHLQKKVDEHHPRADVFAEHETPKWEVTCQNPKCTGGGDSKPATFKAFVQTKRFCSERCRAQAKNWGNSARKAGGMGPAANPAGPQAGGCSPSL